MIIYLSVSCAPPPPAVFPQRAMPPVQDFETEPPVIETSDTASGPLISHLPRSGCPYPLDIYWDIVGYEGPQNWGSFEALPDGPGCLLWLQSEGPARPLTARRLRLLDAELQEPWWNWRGGVRTSEWDGWVVLIEGLPDGPWALEIR